MQPRTVVQSINSFSRKGKRSLVFNADVFDINLEMPNTDAELSQNKETLLF